MKYLLNTKRGFTLVEILVAIAIMGILAMIVFASFEDSRKKARDTKRMSDIQEIAASVAIYGASQGQYPSSLNDLVTAGLFREVPTDPTSTGVYVYNYENEGNCFRLTGTREMTEETISAGNCAD